MKITKTGNLRHMYLEVELSHPDYSSSYECWFIEYDYDEVDNFDEIIGEHIRKNVNDFYHNVTLKAEYVIDGKLYISKDTYSVATGERVKVATEVYNLK